MYYCDTITLKVILSGNGESRFQIPFLTRLMGQIPLNQLKIPNRLNSLTIH